MSKYFEHTKGKQHIEFNLQKYGKKKNIRKKLSYYNLQRYKALSTSKKENQKWWNRQLAQSPKKSVLNIT